MKSEFQFLSYKVDSIELKMRHSLGMLAQKTFDRDWEVEIGLRLPQFYTADKLYLAGVDCSMTYPPIENEENEKPSISISGGIMGVFKVEEGRFEPEVEKRLVTTHFPTLVMPYLRAVLTSTLAGAGVGIHVFPLINLHEVAAQTLKDEEIRIHP
jgi:preprotein translocase subunit SecB